MRLPPGHQIEVHYENELDGTKYDSFTAAQIDILEKHAAGIAVSDVEEVDERGFSVRDLGCEWSVKLVAL